MKMLQTLWRKFLYIGNPDVVLRKRLLVIASLYIAFFFGGLAELLAASSPLMGSVGVPVFGGIVTIVMIVFTVVLWHRKGEK